MLHSAAAYGIIKVNREKTNHGIKEITMKIAVISDTHGVLRPRVCEILRESDAVIHAGDFTSRAVLDAVRAELREGVPLYAVLGNNDWSLAGDLPASLEFEIDGFTFYMAHNRMDIPAKLDTDFVIFGHSHEYHEEPRYGQMWLNPGSCGRKRFGTYVTMAVITTANGSYRVERIDLEQ